MNALLEIIYTKSNTPLRFDYEQEIKKKVLKL